MYLLSRLLLTVSLVAFSLHVINKILLDLKQEQKLCDPMTHDKNNSRWSGG